MFGRKEREKLENEVVFLRGMVKDLTDRLMALTGEPHARFHAEKRTEQSIMQEASEPTLGQVIVGKISEMQAMNNEEKRQKEEAMDFAQTIIGGGSHA